ncbi:MAG: DUF2334 domain-containing protein [Peptococcaceae bacterium]|nr:DUF2334 domain-containing protein [Peptococcaceae bacterium]
MFRKVLYLMGLLVFLALFAFIHREATRPFTISKQSGALGAAQQKKGVIRLEDVSPGAYDTAGKLGKLEAIADYLHQEGVPFHVSVIPVYRDPKNNVEISIGDTGNPHVRDFIKTIKYMRDKGGLIGLHGYTHQYLSEVSGSGYEFMERGALVYARPEYAEERVKKALELMDKAGIPVDYWETPHYTASPDQYRVLGNYFGLLYEPNPKDRTLKNVSSWDSTGPDNQNVVFVPAPLLNVTGEKDVDRILNQLDKKDPSVLAAFFFHPFQEFRFMYKMRAPEGYEFYVHETNSYLHRLVEGFKSRGYRFVTVYDLIGFLPAQRVDGLSSTRGKVLLTGDFDGDGRWDFLAGDPAAGRWLVTVSRVERALPRNNPQAFGPPAEWLDNWKPGGPGDFVAGDFNADGKRDLAFRDRNTGEIKVALSDGSRFVPQQQPWGRFSTSGGPVEVLAADFNGDGRDDLLCWVRGENTAWVMRSEGNGFSPAAAWLKNWPRGGDCTVLAGDFNGDGKKDLAVLDKATGTVRVALSNGFTFAPSRGSGDQTWINNFAAGDRWQVLAGDFNGDGTGDLAAYDCADGRWEFARAAGGRFLPENWFVTYGKDPEGRAVAGDFNGDGRFDLAVERHFAGDLTPLDIALSVLGSRKK